MEPNYLTWYLLLVIALQNVAIYCQSDRIKEYKAHLKECQNDIAFFKQYLQFIEK